MADGFGRKHTLCTLSLAQLGAWGMYMIATNATDLYIAGALAGFGGGGALLCVLLFVAEIAEDAVRGRLAAVTAVASHVGQLLAVVPMCFVSALHATFGLCVLPLAFVLAFVYYPDTPFQLRKEHQRRLALESLYLYRGARLPADQASDYAKKEVLRFQQTRCDAALSFANLVTPAARRAFVCVGVLTVAQQLTAGAVWWLVYADGGVMRGLWAPQHSDGVCALAAALQVVGAVVAWALVERTGRRGVLLVSCAGTAIAFAVLAVLLQTGGGSEAAFVSVLAAVALCGSLGVVSLPVVLLVDLMPQQIRGVGATVCLTFGWALLLGGQQVGAACGLDVAIVAYCAAGACVLAGVVTATVVPDTRGRSNEEIVLAASSASSVSR